MTILLVVVSSAIYSYLIFKFCCTVTINIFEEIYSLKKISIHVLFYCLYVNTNETVKTQHKEKFFLPYFNQRKTILRIGKIYSKKGTSLNIILNLSYIAEDFQMHLAKQLLLKFRFQMIDSSMHFSYFINLWRF